jgi:hypothetical protein
MLFQGNLSLIQHRTKFEDELLENDETIKTYDEFEINIKSQLRFGTAQKIIDSKCKEIIEDTSKKDKFLLRIK